MVHSDLLVSLVKASATGDRRLLRSSVEAIIAEERSKQHHVLADRLSGALSPGMNGAAQSVSENVVRARDFVAEIHPRKKMDDLVLPETVRLGCSQLVEEQQRADLLRASGLEPRHSVLLAGPPGNGKTSLAEAIAESLSVPLFVVRYDLMIGSFLGETATRLKKVLDYARTTPCVLFFDEFDSIGKERGDKHETGEIKRVVSSLLMQIDDLPSYTVVIAATNHSELLDRAVWRRFQFRFSLPQPTPAQVARYVSLVLGRFGVFRSVNSTTIARRLGSVSYGEAEQFCLDVVRRHVLSLAERPVTSLVAEQLKIWESRVVGQHQSKEASRRARTPNSKTSRAHRSKSS